MNFTPQKKLFLLASCHIFFFSDAQLVISGQLRTRSEWRDGQGTPLQKGQKPAFFTSQRSRLHFLFNSYRVKTNISIQDVRVWGQDASMINRTTSADNNGFMLHEAWAEMQITDTSSKKNIVQLKIGRQELTYDDQRLLGNLDWLQQARRHDAIVIKYLHKNLSIHAGGAFNQNKEKSSGTLYDNTPAGNYAASTNGSPMYKSMEFLHASQKLKSGQLSILFFSDQFNTYRIDTTNGGVTKSFTNGAWARYTFGAYFTRHIGNIELSASVYQQTGRNSMGKKVDGRLLSVAGQYRVSRLNFGLGVDFTTPHFDPLYGTPHKFWGSMDYFYAGSPFGNNGLADYYLKTKITASDKLLIAAGYHYFNAASSTEGFSRRYGQEIDIVASYEFTKETSFEAGYSHFFAAPLLTSALSKNIVNAKNQSGWAYLMINIKPSFLFK